MAHARNSSSASPETRERLQRVLADAGVAARRVCESMIEEGRVTVNGETVRRLPVFVDPQVDRILVDGRPIPRPERPVYIMLNKPERTLVTTADEPGMDRRTVAQLVDHPAAPRLFPVGRLDFDTTGLVLLTNDGDLANSLSHPRFGMPKTYHATLSGDITPELLGLIQRRAKDVAKKRSAEARSERRERLGPGPQPGPRKRDLSPLDARIAATEDGKTVLEITLVESRQRPIKEILLSIGLPLRKLRRVAIGPLQLKHLPLGNWRELTRDEVRLLKLAAAGRLADPRPRTPPVRPLRTQPRRPFPKSPARSGTERAGAAPSGHKRPSKPKTERRPQRRGQERPRP